MRILRAALLGTAIVLSVTAAAAGPDGDGRFQWTTKSSQAKELLLELQARIENFQAGADTVALAERVVAADPEFAMGVYYLSAVSPPPGNAEILEKAAGMAVRASDGERRFIEAMVRARANGGAGFAEAVPLLEALQTDYPNERLVVMILGQIYLATGEADKARSAFERALAIGPSSNRARSFLANDDLLQGNYRKARDTFHAIAKQLPEGSTPAPIRYGVAFSYLYEGRDEEAIRALSTFLDEYKQSGASQAFPEVFIWNSIARIHLENGRPEKALEAYDSGYRSVPGSNMPEDQKTVWFGRLKHGKSRALAKQGKFDEAWRYADELHQMIEDGGENGAQYVPAYHYLAGYLKLEAGELEAAAEHLTQANPNDPFHRLLLARAYDALGNEEKAKEVYEGILSSTNNGLERALAFPEAKRRLEG